MHHLLERQIKKNFKGARSHSPEQEAFLKAVNESYYGHDQDRALLERSFDISSREFAELNSKVSKLLEELRIEKENVEQKVVERTRELKQKMADLDASNQLLATRESELAVANEHLRGLDKAKTEFIQIAAHQLRTPMTPISWILEELKTTVKTTRVKRQIEDALNRTRVMMSLIDSMLNLSRIEASKFLSEKQPTDIRNGITDLFQSFEPLARKKNLTYTIQLPTEKMQPIHLAPEFMQVAVSNLIDNAINYTPEGGSVTILVHEENDKVLIRVRDTGIGIPRDERHKVFTKLYRSKKSMRLQSMGMGIGLYTAHAIVAAHGGELTLEESEEDKGSTFRIVLPRGLHE